MEKRPNRYFCIGYSTLFPFFPGWLEDENLPEYSFPLPRNWTAQEFYSKFYFISISYCSWTKPIKHFTWRHTWSYQYPEGEVTSQHPSLTDFAGWKYQLSTFDSLKKGFSFFHRTHGKTGLFSCYGTTDCTMARKDRGSDFTNFDLHPHM